MPNLNKFRVLYFVQFSAYGILCPYIPLFYEVLRLTKSQIGILTMIPSVCTFLVAPVFSFAGDKFNAHGEVLIISMLVSTVASMTMLYWNSFVAQLIICLVVAVFRSPLGPEIDSIVLEALPDKSLYGTLRLWGAVSFGLCSLAGGVLTNVRDIDDVDIENGPFMLLFYISGISSILAAFVIIHILSDEMVRNRIYGVKVEKDNNIAYQSAADVEMDVSQSGGDKNSSSDLLIHNTTNPTLEPAVNHNVASQLRQVLRKNPEVMVFGLIVFLSGLGAGAIDSYLFLFLKELGGTGLLMGLARLMTCVAEVPLFQIAGSLQAYYGTWALITFTQFAFVVRFVYYVLLMEPWWVLPCELLNGVTFAITWSVSCTYANEISPPGCKAVMQALVEGLHFGLGYGTGSLLGGYGYEYLGGRRMFAVCALLSVGSTILSFVTWKVLSSGENAQEHGNHGEKEGDISYLELQQLDDNNVEL